jgi:hypothetical protein
MPIKAYTVLGWAAWRVIKRLAKYEMGQNKVKLGAAATVLAVIVGGLAAARAATSSDDSS